MPYGVGTFQCPYCPDKFTNVGSLSAHYTNDHPDSPKAKSLKRGRATAAAVRRENRAAREAVDQARGPEALPNGQHTLAELQHLLNDTQRQVEKLMRRREKAKARLEGIEARLRGLLGTQRIEEPKATNLEIEP